MTSKRQIIINTATRLFKAYGYRSIGVDRIIAEAGVAKMTMYKHFASKSELIGTVLKERDAQIQASLFSFVDSFHDPFDRLKAFFTWYDRWLNEASFNGCMFISASVEFSNTNEEISLLSRQHKQVIQDHLTDTLQQLLDDNKVAQSMGRQLLQLLEGSIITGQIFNDQNAALTAWRTAATLLKAERLSMDNSHCYSE